MSGTQDPSQPVSTELRDGIAIVWIDNPPVNALSHAVRSGIAEAAIQIEQDAAIKAVVLACRGRTFIAGADIREFNAPAKEPHLPDLINRIEASGKPWIAAIHGTALGGGLETAMGCHYRVGVESARIGLPEVNLGLIPGAGGTIRLPRLAGPEFAVDVMSSGKPVSAAAAAEHGVFDALAGDDDNLAEFAIAFARRIQSDPLPTPLSTREVTALPDDTWWEKKISAIAARARGQRSPVAAAEAARNGLEKPFTEALADERALFAELKDGDQSKAMRHVFFAERETTKVPAIREAEPRRVDTIAVVGGGTMGAGIAAASLLNGYSVRMIERDGEAAAAGHDRVMSILDSSLKRGVIDAEKRSQLESRFRSAAGYEHAGDANLAIEAVFEDMAVKKDVFSRLDATVGADCILASNTSYLDVGEIAAATSNPARVIGMHFFSPAHVMKLVEVIAPQSASAEALATGFAVARRLRKIPVWSGVCDGFIGNRILYEYRKACDAMLEDGAMPHEIDAAMKGFGLPMGPYEMADMAGLDIGWATRKRKAATRDPNERYVKIADRICELGRFGQKTGAGWYSYEKDPRKGERDPLVEEIIREESANNGITRRSFTPDEITRTIVAAMATEGAKILDEGIALRSSDIDMVMILGYGFPRWRGGPMFMKEQGLA